MAREPSHDTVERVAQALYRHSMKQLGRMPLEWFDTPDDPWLFFWRDMARVAMEAMEQDADA